jgi:hypothetical protein
MKTKVVKWLKNLIKEHCHSKGYASMRGHRLEWKVGYEMIDGDWEWNGDIFSGYENMADYIIENKIGVFNIWTPYIIDDVNTDLLFDNYQEFNLDDILNRRLVK